ncbi:CBP3 [Acanthosepion pharaonis]|uniref:CBP3 n=1 Tax=Acanthosepion pharaonis TaxID=158019 RepID=A0A812D793_ACAPH|nr:CBP3 [Sepia pharaonis]
MNRVPSIFRSLGNSTLKNIAVSSQNFSSNLQSHMMLRTASAASMNLQNLRDKNNIWTVPKIQNCNRWIQIRMVSSGWVQNLKTKIGWPQKLKYSKYRLVESAYRLYMCAVEIPDYFSMIHDLQMPDTYYSWHLISELHIWMVLVRLSTCEEEGKFIRGHFMKAFWEDVKKRSSKVGRSPSRQEELKLLNYHFNAAIFNYDEGLLSDDRVLASSLWRIFFEDKVAEPHLLELMVQYVRKQVKHLNDQQDDVILQSGLISFLPFNSDVEDKVKIERIWKRVKESDLLIKP